MPKELEEHDWEASKPKGMKELTLSHEYNEIWTALESGLRPSQFRMLPYDEQAELTAYWYVNSRIKSFYADEQRQVAEKKRQEMEAEAKKRGNMRQ
jgi:hypothetical protein